MVIQSKSEIRYRAVGVPSVVAKVRVGMWRPLTTPKWLSVQVQQGRIDAERLSEELGSERRDLRAWEERLKGRKEELDREKATAEGKDRFALAVSLCSALRIVMPAQQGRGHRDQW